MLAAEQLLQWYPPDELNLLVHNLVAIAFVWWVNCHRLNQLVNRRQVKQPSKMSWKTETNAYSCEFRAIAVRMANRRIKMVRFNQIANGRFEIPKFKNSIPNWHANVCLVRFYCLRLLNRFAFRTIFTGGRLALKPLNFHFNCCQ